MGDLKVEVVEIEKVQNHENADRLSIATVFGYSVVVGKDSYKAGDHAVYFPVDSILPADLEDVIFAGGKMKLSKHRVRAARIRGCVSQGLLVDIPKIKAYMLRNHDFQVEPWYIRVGEDLTEDLGVTKRDPEANKPAVLKGNQAPKRETSPFFRKYTSIQHLKKFNTAFEHGQEVYITEKIHGTNFRAGWVPTVARSYTDRFRIKLSNSRFTLIRMLGLPKFTFVFGSHNVQLKPNSDEGFHGNVYEQCVLANDLKNKIRYNEVWYGEIYGPGVQKGYGYGLDEGNYGVRFFDVMIATTGKYVDFDHVVLACANRGLKSVPYEMAYFDTDRLNTALNDPTPFSSLDGKTKIEGFVVRSYNENSFLGSGRKVLKWISDSYLLQKGNTEFK